MKKILVLGFGNLDREDDGVAWHVLYRLASRLGYPLPSLEDDSLEISGLQADLLYTLQLTPEIAETVSEYERVCFVDAHTGSIPEELGVHEIQPQYQASPLTHHMTPETCLALAQSLYGQAPHSVLVSILGHQFEFERALSRPTSQLADQAVTYILDWLREGNDREIS